MQNVANAAKDMTESDVRTRGKLHAVNGLITVGEEGGNRSKRPFNSILIHVIVNLHYSWYI